MQDDLKCEDQEEADKIFRANSSPRYKRLSEFERWVEGRQYDGLPSFWGDDFPLWDRAPCIVYPVTAIAIDSYVDLLLGESRFPKFSSKPGEDNADEEDGLGPDDSAALDRFLASWHKLSKFRTVSREALGSAMGVCSVAVVHGVRDDRPFADLIPAKWCEPKLGQSGEVLSAEIRYPYQEQFKDPANGKWTVRTRLYRRVIDAKRDVEFLPGDANEQGVEPEWKENPSRSVDHDFGFCPVVWYPFMRGCVPVNEIDGKPIQLNITDEIRAHDMARSQWHRGALMSEPQMYEIGVPPGYNPTEPGVTPRVLTTERGGSVTPQNQVTGGFGDAKSKPARKRGPGYVWQYPEKAEVDAIFYPAEALKAQEENCADLRIKLMEMFGAVLLDPESLKSIRQLSGKTLEALKQKQLDRCDKIREDLNERYFGPSLSMQLRIARAVLARKSKLRVAGATKAQAILDKFADADKWHPPALQTAWGDYFKADPSEQQLLVTMVVAALECDTPILTVRVAVEKLAPIFGIDDVTAFLAELQKEVDGGAAKKSADASADIKAAMAQLTKPNATPPNGSGAPPAEAGTAGSSKRPLEAAAVGSV